jgi:hypothetical protein
MNSAISDSKTKRKTHKKRAEMHYNKDRWPLYTGREPTLEEFEESIKSLTDADITRILTTAGIIDEDGNLTEIYRS